MRHGIATGWAGILPDLAERIRCLLVNRHAFVIRTGLVPRLPAAGHGPRCCRQSFGFGVLVEEPDGAGGDRVRADPPVDADRDRPDAELTGAHAEQREAVLGVRKENVDDRDSRRSVSAVLARLASPGVLPSDARGRLRHMKGHA